MRFETKKCQKSVFFLSFFSQIVVGVCKIITVRSSCLPITFVNIVSHESAQALRSITFRQRFRTTRHLFSIQLLRKPKILNLEDKQTKFEQSNGDLDQFSELCKRSLIERI